LIQLSKYYHLSPDKITREQFKEYLYYLVEEKQVSAVFLNLLISAYKILIVEVLRREWEDFNIRRPSRSMKLPVVLSQKEVKRIIEITPNLKHRAFISLIYSCGLRLEELCNLKVADIDSDRMQIHIRSGKGNKDRYVMLSEKILLLLREYWKRYRPKEYLFEGVVRGKAISRRLRFIPICRLRQLLSKVLLMIWTCKKYGYKSDSIHFSASWGCVQARKQFIRCSTQGHI